MTKAEVVAAISKNTGIDKTNVLAIVEQFMAVVKEALANNENICIHDFGTFMCKERAQKPARNITAKTTVIIPAHSIPFFKPAKSFKAEVAKL